MKNAALSKATGATILAVLASAGKNCSNWVTGAVSAFETGRRFWNSGLSDSIVWFSEAPRAAKAFPKPSRTTRLFSRVGVSKVLAMSSNSVCCSACSMGRLAALRDPGSPSPRTISRYLSPKEER